MEPTQFEGLDRLADDVYDKFEELRKKGLFADLEEKLKQACAKLGKNYSVSFNVDLDVFDSEKEKGMVLIKTGVACSGGDQPHRADGTSSVHTYIVNGMIRKVPHEYCPGCWGEWGFKLMHQACPHCGMKMGKEICLLLDTDICPNCEKGKVSRSNPKCNECNYAVDLKMVRWG